MVRIAVCDNEEHCREELRALIQRLPFPVSCAVFDDGASLLAACGGQQDPFELIFLDIELADGKSGIDLASALRERMRDVMLIFVSGYPHYITAALKTQPDQFLVKPVRADDFWDAVSSVMERRRQRKAAAKFTFQYRSELVTLRQDEICYLEASGHHIRIAHTRGEPLLVPGTISREEKRFLPCGFIKVHRSYLVNLHHIRRIEGRNIIMESGDRLPISKGLYQRVFDQYTTYISAILEDLS